jgi:hypothetical protein
MGSTRPTGAEQGFRIEWNGGEIDEGGARGIFPTASEAVLWLTVAFALQKAKSDNKFYAAMRDKEAVEMDRKTLERGNKIQQQLVAKLQDSEKNLESQLVRLEAISDVPSLITCNTAYRYTGVGTPQSTGGDGTEREGKVQSRSGGS